MKRKIKISALTFEINEKIAKKKKLIIYFNKIN